MNTSPGAAYDANRNKRLLMKNKDAHYNQTGEDDEYLMNATDTKSADVSRGAPTDSFD